MKIHSLITCGILLVALTGCDPVMNWFNGVGEHMPVIGERCEYWQCFTESGQRISEERKQNAQGRITQPMKPIPGNPPAAKPPVLVPGGPINTAPPQ